MVTTTMGSHWTRKQWGYGHARKTHFGERFLSPSPTSKRITGMTRSRNLAFLVTSRHLDWHQERWEAGEPQKCAGAATASHPLRPPSVAAVHFHLPNLLLQVLRTHHSRVTQWNSGKRSFVKLTQSKATHLQMLKIPWDDIMTEGRGGRSPGERQWKCMALCPGECELLWLFWWGWKGPCYGSTVTLDASVYGVDAVLVMGATTYFSVWWFPVISDLLASYRDSTAEPNGDIIEATTPVSFPSLRVVLISAISPSWWPTSGLLFCLERGGAV